MAIKPGETIEVLKAKIVDVSELKKTKNGLEHLIVYIENNKGIAGRFFIFRGRSKNFDIIRKFEMGVFKEGTQIRFKWTKSKKRFNYIRDMKTI